MPKKQKSGLYRSKVRIGTDPNGKPIDKWISGKTKKELEEQRQQVIAYYIDGTALREDKLFGTYVQEWYHTRKEPFIKSASTAASYKSALNKHILPAFGNRNLRAITGMELQRWLNTYTGKSDTTLTQFMTILRDVFAAAVADRIVDVNPASGLRMPTVGEESERRALTPEERTKVLRLVDTLLDDPQRAHEARYLATLYYLGVRPGEARGLQWGDFDWTTDEVHIQRDIDYAKRGEDLTGELKTNAGNRVIPVPAPLKDILFPCRGLPTAFVFTGVKSGQPYSKSSAECIWLRLMRDLGWVERRDTQAKYNDLRAEYKATITPYYFRHNFITMCWEAGLDPLVTMRIVGHADYRTTANIYTHLNESHLQKARVKIESVFAQQEQDKNKVAQKLHNFVESGVENKRKALKIQ